MGFQGIGIWEIVLILVVIMIVLGPKRLPEIARTLGKAVRAIKKASSDLTTAVSRELDETKKEAPSSGRENPETKQPTPTTGKASITGRDNHPPKPEGHQQRND